MGKEIPIIHMVPHRQEGRHVLKSCACSNIDQHRAHLKSVLAFLLVFHLHQEPFGTLHTASYILRKYRQ